MKKNRMMRAASALLVAVLMTTCTISGTFAKYVTQNSGSDKARVAKWGVEIIAEGSSYATEYATHDSEKYAGATVISTEKVVAPGTASSDVNGDLVFTIKGTPEVASKITIAFDATSDIFYGNYHPVVFTLDVKDTNAALTDSDQWIAAKTGTLAEIEEFLEKTYSANGSFYSDPNVPLDAQYKLSWAWAFENDNEADTILGNLAAGMTAEKAGVAAGTAYSTNLEYGATITIEQVD